MCSGARQFPRPLADVVAAINGAAQIPHLRATVDDLTRQRSNVLEPGDTFVLRESPVDHGGGVFAPAVGEQWLCECPRPFASITVGYWATVDGFSRFIHDGCGRPVSWQSVPPATAYSHPQRAVAAPPGRDISDTRSGTDNTHGQLAPSVAQDSDRGTIHAANEAVSETKRHDD